ncbi:MAG TPA: ABC transporter substrate-binding protein [Firmicutes bacterium]|jgi:ribose transport system substrate-binding protein|nr:ABC transporter substrate-binding protein [Bacillota bacterium]
MRRTIVTLTLLCLVTLLFVPAALAQDKVVIGVSIPAATHGWTGGINYWAKVTQERLKETYPNLEIILVTAGSAAEQANTLEDLYAIHNIDALVILPFESDPLTDPVEMLKMQGVFITVVDRGLTKEGVADIYVAGDNHALGRVSGEYMVEALGGKGDIVVLRGIPTVIDNYRFDSFMEVVEGTDINVLDWQYANWNRDDGFQVMQDFLARFPKIDAVWAQDDDVALGVIEAVKQAGREEELFIVGGAGMKEMIARVMEADRLIPVDVLYPPAMIATGMEVTALRFVSNASVLGEYILDATLVTPENAHLYYFPDSPF